MPAPRLTDRELEVLKLVAKGLNNRDIADDLYISETRSRTTSATCWRSCSSTPGWRPWSTPSASSCSNQLSGTPVRAPTAASLAAPAGGAGRPALVELAGADAVADWCVDLLGGGDWTDPEPRSSTGSAGAARWRWSRRTSTSCTGRGSGPPAPCCTPTTRRPTGPWWLGCPTSRGGCARCAPRSSAPTELGSTADELAPRCADDVPRVTAAAVRALGCCVGEAEHADAVRELPRRPRAVCARRRREAPCAPFSAASTAPSDP